MTSHDELVAEMTNIEKMQMADRLKLARKRRAQQLKQYQQYEKQLSRDGGKRSKKAGGGEGSGVGATANGAVGGGGNSGTAAAVGRTRKGSRRLRFADSVLLLDATIRNDIDEVKNLLNSDISPDTANIDGLTALHQCCIDNLEEMLRLLVERGANVNARDTELWTPLHAAATCGHVRLCRYLCDHGADLLAVNADGNMPYDLCEDVTTLDYIESEMSKRGITQELIDETRMMSESAMLADLQNIVNEGRDPEYRGPSGETPLHIAACNGFVSVVDFLLSQHVAVDAVDNDEWRPIHCASCWGQYAVLEILLEHGADIEATTKNGETALDLCEDIDMKQRILELTDEIRNKRSTRLRLDPSASSARRNSTARRGSMVNPASHGLCIRRSSLHERNLLSAKDVREEATILRESISSHNDDEDEEDGGGSEDDQILDAITVSPAQIQQLMSSSAPLASPDDSSYFTTTTTSSNNNYVIANSSSRVHAVDSSSKSRHQLSEQPPSPLPTITVTSAAAGDGRHQSSSSSSGSARRAATNGGGGGTGGAGDDLSGPGSSFTATAAASSDNRPPGIPPTGTLSDLKKQRSRGLQERLLGRMLTTTKDGLGNVPNGGGSAAGAAGSASAAGQRPSLTVAEIYGLPPVSTQSPTQVQQQQQPQMTEKRAADGDDDGCCRVM